MTSEVALKLQEAAKATALASGKAPQQTVADQMQEQEKPVQKHGTFYTHVPGMRAYLPDGTPLVFLHGEYQCKNHAEEVHLLSVMRASPSMVRLTPSRLVQNDSLVMREVGGKGAANSINIGPIRSTS